MPSDKKRRPRMQVTMFPHQILALKRIAEEDGRDIGAVARKAITTGLEVLEAKREGRREQALFKFHIPFGNLVVDDDGLQHTGVMVHVIAETVAQARAMVRSYGLQNWVATGWANIVEPVVFPTTVPGVVGWKE